MSVASLHLLSAESRCDGRVRAVLVAAGYRIVNSESSAAAAIIVGDTDEASLSLVGRVRARELTLPVILVASHGSERLAVAAFEAGVSGYLSEPWTPEDLLALLKRVHLTREDDEPQLAGPVLIGSSHSISELRRYVRQVATTDCNVLILGETGTGKEVVAESLHANSPRRDKPFVCINSVAIPESLVESELFGHERGAFTGATFSQVGKLVFANRGTVFLDEVGDVAPSIQAKLLRTIESRRVYQLGSNRAIDLDIRVVAGTNQDLEKAMGENRFRRDLYYRLNVVRIDLLPLRERPEDIPLLIRHFFDHFNSRWKRRLSGLSPRALDVLLSYSWPGNVRELRNVVEALFASLSPEVCGVVDMPPQVMRHLTFAADATETERDKMLKVLIATNWNRSKASEQLHWSRMTLYRKMQKHQLSSNRAKDRAS